MSEFSSKLLKASSFVMSSRGGLGGPQHAKTRLPNPGEVFHEGYIHLRKTRVFMTTTTRVFCVLHGGNLMLHERWSWITDDTPPPFGSFPIDDSIAFESPTPTQLTLTSSTWSMSWGLDSVEDVQEWITWIKAEMASDDDEVLNRVPPIRARYFEGYLFKTPAVPDKWEERWFELTPRGELIYYSKFGQIPEKGRIDLETCKIVPNQTQARGICTPYYFQIHTFEPIEEDGAMRKRVFNLSAPTKEEYLAWLKALKVWMGVKRPERFIV